MSEPPSEITTASGVHDEKSHVLSAMGYDATVAQGAVRLSLGWSTEPGDINRALEAWRKLGNTLLKG